MYCACVVQVPITPPQCCHRWERKWAVVQCAIFKKNLVANQSAPRGQCGRAKNKQNFFTNISLFHNTYTQIRILLNKPIAVVTFGLLKGQDGKNVSASLITYLSLRGKASFYLVHVSRQLKETALSKFFTTNR